MWFADVFELPLGLNSLVSMEARHFQLQICLMLGFVLMFGVNEGQKSCTENYISKAYFEKKAILDDLEFDNFVKSEISSCSCEVLKDDLKIPPTLLNLHRNLTGEGSHRRLSSSIRLGYELSEQSCEVVIIEKLPSGVFADPFELQHLVQRKVFGDAAVFGDTNLELPSFRSNRSLVEIHTKISPGMLSENSKQLEINIQLPLHARYPPLGQGFQQVQFGLPDILTRCSIEGEYLNQSCVFMPSDQSIESDAAPITWEVPCGKKEHAGIVSNATFISAIISASLIVLTSVYYHSNLTPRGDIKQS